MNLTPNLQLYLTEGHNGVKAFTANGSLLSATVSRDIKN